MVQNREETFESELESYKKLFMVEIESYVDKEHGNLDNKKSKRTEILDTTIETLKESVLVMEKGKLLAHGAYDELIHSCDYFRKICEIKFG